MEAKLSETDISTWTNKTQTMCVDRYHEREQRKQITKSEKKQWLVWGLSTNFQLYFDGTYIHTEWRVSSKQIQEKSLDITALCSRTMKKYTTKATSEFFLGPNTGMLPDLIPVRSASGFTCCTGLTHHQQGRYSAVQPVTDSCVTKYYIMMMNLRLWSNVQLLLVP